MSADPFSLKQPSAQVISVAVIDEVHQPGESWSFSMKYKGAIGVHLQESMCDILTKRYLTGSPQDGMMEPIAFPQVGGEDIEISKDLFEAASRIWAMQIGASSIPALGDINAEIKGGMSAEQIIALAAIAPGAWVDLLRQTTKIANKAGKGLED